MNPDTGWRLLLSVSAIVLVWLLAKALRALTRAVLRGRDDVRARFWTRQAVQLSTTVLLLLLLLSIWFDRPGRLAMPIGLLTAGLAVALQRVVLALAGYFVILSGKVFNVGDRITMGGVRGDVIALGYTRTVIMEMGQPPAVQEDDPAMWIGARQFTGRIVTITNDKLFDEPVYNYTRDFPYIWEEIRLPVRYQDDRARAEEILLQAARRHTTPVAQMGREALQNMRRRYFVQAADLEPRVFLRITDNWLELAVRFVVPEHGIREIKDAISRDVLAALDQAGIGVASATFEVTQLPPLRVSGAPRA
ncbi:MAG: mechanosensitive ion channel family protein [Gemmatimonadetes bacterium]|nr:mechanosensitive ion channel family protein [Gemmatimonadota bacterium]